MRRTGSRIVVGGVLVLVALAAFLAWRSAAPSDVAPSPASAARAAQATPAVEPPKTMPPVPTDAPSPTAPKPRRPRAPRSDDEIDVLVVSGEDGAPLSGAEVQTIDDEDRATTIAVCDESGRARVSRGALGD